LFFRWRYGASIIDPVLLQGFVAYKSNGKQRAVKKIEPAVTELNFRPDPVPIAGQGPGAAPGAIDYYIDLNQVNSIVNRRFYRQGLINAVASIKITTQSQVAGVDVPVTTAPRGEITVAKVPTTWVMANSWMKSFAVWTRMNEQALAESESVRPRFLDFKIYADQAHHTAGYSANLMPISSGLGFGANTVAIPGEWESSKIVIPDTTQTSGVREREFLAVGANYPGLGASGLDAVSLIEGYAASRALPQINDPNTPNDALSADGATPANWMAATFNDGTQQTDSVLTDMVTENNQAPYPFEDDGVNIDTMYPGGANQLSTLALHDFEKVTGSTIGGTTYLRGGAFPCGLIKITMQNYSEEYVIQPVIQINLMPGHHRGLLCEPMQEM
jgi:hypothetical protein